jgi:hypothetical protein
MSENSGRVEKVPSHRTARSNLRPALESNGLGCRRSTESGCECLEEADGQAGEVQLELELEVELENEKESIPPRQPEAGGNESERSQDLWYSTSVEGEGGKGGKEFHLFVVWVGE